MLCPAGAYSAFEGSSLVPTRNLCRRPSLSRARESRNLSALESASSPACFSDPSCLRCVLPTYPPLNPPLLRLACRIRAACGAFCPAVPLLVPASSVLPRVPIPDQPSVRTSPPRQASPLAILARRAPTFRLSVSDRAESALPVFAHAPASSCAYKSTSISKNYWLQARRSRLIQAMTLRSCLKRSCTDGASLAGASSCTACPNGTYASTTGRPTAG